MGENAPDEVIRFWFDDTDHAKWFRKDPAFDRLMEERFGALLERAKGGEIDHWLDSASGYLALIILLDQFSRNIHRGSAEAFAADDKALEICLDGIERGLDEELTLEQRSFFYLPLRHAEDLAMQKLGLDKTRELNADGYGSDKYAISHLSIIELFGRFPQRNEALGRDNTPEESAWLAEGSAGF